MNTRAGLYAHYGYGRATPRRGEPNTPRYMHNQALAMLPALPEHLAAGGPFLLGHSGGGSIVPIKAGGSPRPLAGVIVMAPACGSSRSPWRASGTASRPPRAATSSSASAATTPMPAPYSRPGVRSG